VRGLKLGRKLVSVGMGLVEGHKLLEVVHQGGVFNYEITHDSIQSRTHHRSSLRVTTIHEAPI
jgi:hypothetical protein